MRDVEKTPRQSIEITAKAKAALESMTGWSGMTQKIVVERLLLWAGSQAPDLMAPILMAVPMEMQPDLAELVLERLRRKKRELLHLAAKEATEPHSTTAEDLMGEKNLLGGRTIPRAKR